MPVPPALSYGFPLYIQTLYVHTMCPVCLCLPAKQLYNAKSPSCQLVTRHPHTFLIQSVVNCVNRTLLSHPVIPFSSPIPTEWNMKKSIHSKDDIFDYICFCFSTLLSPNNSNRIQFNAYHKFRQHKNTNNKWRFFSFCLSQFSICILRKQRIN